LKKFLYIPFEILWISPNSFKFLGFSSNFFKFLQISSNFTTGHGEISAKRILQKKHFTTGHGKISAKKSRKKKNPGKIFLKNFSEKKVGTDGRRFNFWTKNFPTVFLKGKRPRKKRLKNQRTALDPGHI